MQFLRTTGEQTAKVARARAKDFSSIFCTFIWILVASHRLYLNPCWSTFAWKIFRNDYNCRQDYLKSCETWATIEWRRKWKFNCKSTSPFWAFLRERKKGQNWRRKSKKTDYWKIKSAENSIENSWKRNELINSKLLLCTARTKLRPRK